MSKNNQKIGNATFYKNGNKNPVAVDGILNINWLKEEAKKITPEKAQAIISRNEALSRVPQNKRNK